MKLLLLIENIRRYFTLDYVPSRILIHKIFLHKSVKSCKISEIALEYKKGKTLTEIAIHKDCTRERIRQILIKFVKMYGR